MTRALMAVSAAMDEQALTKAAEEAGIHLVRRCVDGVDLMAAANVDPSIAVICSLGVPRLQGHHLQELISGGRLVIGLTQHDQQAAELRALGIHQWVSGQGAAATTMRLVAELLGGQAPTGVWEVAQPTLPQAGLVIGITGPHGAPGRTSFVVELARALPKNQVCAIDADLIAPALAFRLQAIDEVSGLMLALRHLDHGTLRPSTIRTSIARSPDGLAVLTGITEGELRQRIDEHRITAVIAETRMVYPWVVVDNGPVTLRGDVHVIVTRPDPLSVLRTFEMLSQEPSQQLAIAVIGHRRDVGLVETAVRKHGFDVPVIRGRAKEVLQHVRELAAPKGTAAR